MTSASDTIGSDLMSGMITLVRSDQVIAIKA